MLETIFESVEITLPPRMYYCEPGWNWNPPPLPDYDLWCVFEGEGELQLNGKSHPLAGRKCFLLKPGDRVLGSQNPRKRLAVFAVHFNFLNQKNEKIILPHHQLPPVPAEIHDLIFFQNLADRCIRSFVQTGALTKFQSKIYLIQLLLLLWNEHSVSHRVRAADDALNSIVLELQRDPSGPLSIGALAKKASLSEVQFRRRFKIHTGMSPVRYKIHVRLERARHLLEETDMKLGHIAEVLGFSDVYFLSKQFKQVFGYPPSAIRKRTQTIRTSSEYSR
jgi:AraC family transcriptional regulator, arabinose operon regulatory protein